MPIGSKFRDHLNEELKNPEFAAGYIMAAMEEKDDVFLAQVLADVVKVHGTTKIAKASKLSRQAIHKMLSAEGNPSLASIHAILEAIGLQITITVKKKSA